MMSYRLFYSVDLPTGHIEKLQEFEAENDDEAMVELERRRGNGPMELWCAALRIMTWPAGH